MSVRNVTKQYTIVHNAQAHTTAGEAFVHLLKRPFQRQEKESFVALRDVSFDVMRGEVVGLVGRNGAGKSTLFKVLSRITEPTAGEIDIYGRVGSLLEVGTGFHPELTGRENIFLNGSILGMRRREIQQKFDEIVAFAEIDRFLDTPVKRYSSGMYVRLAFAVAAHLEPEILIIDEVLAVGDAGFQKKCLGKMKDVAEHGRTILFVSHNMTAVQALCTRCVFLERGRVCFDGDVPQAVRHYESTVLPTSVRGRPGEYDLLQRDNRYLPGELMIRKVTLHDEFGDVTNALPMGRSMALVIDLEGVSEHPDAAVDVTIRNETDGCLIHFNTEMKPPRVLGPRGRSEQAVLRVPRLPLTPGRYWIDVAIENGHGAKLDDAERAANFFVIDADVYGTGQPVRRGIVFLDGEWEIVPADASTEEQSSSSAA